VIVTVSPPNYHPYFGEIFVTVAVKEFLYNTTPDIEAYKLLTLTFASQVTSFEITLLSLAEYSKPKIFISAI